MLVGGVEVNEEREVAGRWVVGVSNDEFWEEGMAGSVVPSCSNDDVVEGDENHGDAWWHDVL